MKIYISYFSYCLLYFITGEDGIEGSGPGTELQAEEGDCVDEDGPISPSERGCPPAAKDDDDAEATDDEDSITSPSTPPPTSTPLRLNPSVLRDTGPPDRYDYCIHIKYIFTFA